jgi:hypothetical protein
LGRFPIPYFYFFHIFNFYFKFPPFNSNSNYYFKFRFPHIKYDPIIVINTIIFPISIYSPSHYLVIKKFNHNFSPHILFYIFFKNFRSRYLISIGCITRNYKQEMQHPIIYLVVI